MIFTLAFWKDAIIRAIKTFAQSAVAILAAGATGLLGTDWVQLLSVAGLAAVVSLLTSISSGDSIGTAYVATPVSTTVTETVEPLTATVSNGPADVSTPTVEDTVSEVSDADISTLAATIPTTDTAITTAAAVPVQAA
jgi:hypothetical protein